MNTLRESGIRIYNNLSDDDKLGYLTVEECGNRLQDLRLIVKFFDHQLQAKNTTFYNCDLVKAMKRKSIDEISRLEELLVNQELFDSYDQNTGRH